MPTFEAAIAASIDELCPDCPIRNLCGQVEMARLEHGVSAEDGPGEVAVAVTEADAAAMIVLSSVFKSRYGCEGAQPFEHGEACSCGNDTACPAYSMVVDLINEDD